MPKATPPILDRLQSHPLWGKVDDGLQTANAVYGRSNLYLDKGSFVETHCPGHPDANPSLWLGVNDEGELWVTDKSGKCNLTHIADRLGVDKSEFKLQSKPRIAAEYIYRDLRGNEVYRKVRTKAKKFYYTHRDANDPKTSRRGRGVTHDQKLLYRMEDVKKARDEGSDLWVTEGEKDAETAAVHYSKYATTNDDGALNWNETDTAKLSGIQGIVLVPDRDSAGAQRLRILWEALHGKCRLRLLTIPDGHKDLTDLHDAGFSQQDVEALISPGGITEKDVKEFESICNSALNKLFEEYAWITIVKKFVRIKDAALFDKEGFDAVHAPDFPLGGKNKTASVNFLNTVKGKRVEALTYYPGEERFVEEEGQEKFNTWAPSPLSPEEGPVDWWLSHLAYLLPDVDQQRVLIQWCANLIQNPASKPNFALFLGGVGGIGKDLLFEPVIRSIGKNNCHYIMPDDLAENNTGFLLNCRLAIVEEMKNFGKVDMKNKLKPIIASPPDVLRIKDKWMIAFYIPNRVACLVFSNEPDALVLEQDDRRWYIAWSEAAPRSEEYYNELWSNIERYSQAVYDYLMKVDLTQFNPRGRAKNTKAKEDMIAINKPMLDAWIAEAINVGHAPFHQRILTLQDIADELGETLARRATLPKIGVALKRHGWIQLRTRADIFHPHDLALLERGETNLNILRDNRRFVRYTVWCRKDHRKELDEHTMTQLGEMYKAQFKMNPYKLEKLEDAILKKTLAAAVGDPMKKVAEG